MSTRAFNLGELKVDGNGNVDIVSINDKLVIPVLASDPSGEVGQLYFNNSGNLRIYTANGWRNVNVKIPDITNISGNIWPGFSTTLTFTGIDFGSFDGIVTFTHNTNEYTATFSVSSDTSGTCVVPSGLYNAVSGGDTVSINVQNSEGGTSGDETKTVGTLPTGGTINSYTSGSTQYRSHAFFSSGSFNTQGNSWTVDALLVAGGGSGGGGDVGGGGGAGGMLEQTGVSANGSYSITVGAGAASSSAAYANQGGNTTALGYTAIGGGAGHSWPQSNPSWPNMNGGSGGGGYSGAGSGTAGQGNNGGTGLASPDYPQGGGGGKSAAGQSGANTGATYIGGAGGDGKANNWRTGSNENYAGGGGGAVEGNQTATSSARGGYGGLGGGGNGGAQNRGGAGTLLPQNGGTNQGGGGGGADPGTGGSGGSGIVVIRYVVS